MKFVTITCLSLIITGLAFFSTPQISAQSTVCNADISQDGIVDLTDYSLLATNFLSTTPSVPRADINSDGIVDLTDYSLLAANFLQLADNCSSATPTPLPINNLLNNGDFETGDLSGWSLNPAGSISVSTADTHSGRYAAHITAAAGGRQDWITVEPGKTYIASAWFKWITMSDDDWGYSRFTVGDDNWQTLAQEANLDQKYPQNQWTKIALTFVPTTSRISIDFGIYGPETNVEYFFDDILVYEKVGNSEPFASPQASTTTGPVPLTVNFTANSDDLDGAIEIHRWQFGDGSESREANPSHTYISPGTKTVTYTAYDNDGASSSKTLVINPTSTSHPQISFTNPTNTGSHTYASDTNVTQTISGTVTSPNDQIVKVTWDNINQNIANNFQINPGQTVNFSEGLYIGPGENEILITATDSQGRVNTNTILVTRNTSGPKISLRSVNTQSPRVYDKYEVDLDITTAAKHPMFMYDDNPPPGVEPGTGITAQGVITLPSGQTVTHPLFYYTPTAKQGSKWVHTSANSFWKLRYSPQETGTHQVKIQVTDKTGTSDLNVGSFTAQAPVKPGYVQVSQADTRYFEYSDGSLMWPFGMTWTGTSGTLEDGTPMSQATLNYDRPWMGGRGAFSSNWYRWISSAEQHGNEGIGIHYSFTQHYPSSEISQHIHYPEGFRMWIACWGDDTFCANIDAGKTYQVKLRVKTKGITGSGDYGLKVVNHGWIGGQTPQEFDNTVAGYQNWIPTIRGDKDWHTIVNRVTAQSGNDDFSIFLSNSTAGEVFIDEFSVREVLANGSLGPEQIRNPRADSHTYVEQRPMAFFDDQAVQGEANQAFNRYVVHDKNDRLINALNDTSGLFVQSGSGYYQPENSKATWIQKQWWRYLVARLGYSTSIFGWELNNEGPPDDGSGSHARHTQLFAKWMHDLDAHPHLANTSFWCCWEPTFWGDNTNFPDVDFADIHHYGSPTDWLDWYLAEAVPAYSDQIGKPIVRAESGIIDGDNTNNYTSGLTGNNPGIWFNNMLWSQLHYTAMFEIGYWFPEHTNGFSRDQMAKSFYNFIKDSDFNKGGYTELTPTNSLSYRFVGQKNLTTNKAYMWLRHPNHTWTNGPVTGSFNFNISLKMNPNTTYRIHPYDIAAGQFGLSKTATSDGSGNFTFSFANIGAQIAFKIEPAN